MRSSSTGSGSAKKLPAVARSSKPIKGRLNAAVKGYMNAVNKAKPIKKSR